MVHSTSMNTTKHILLIEDNQGDARLVKEALQAINANIQLTILTNGADALDYLFKRGAYNLAVTPDLIILDLNIPKKNGKQILSEIKQDDYLRIIPVIILTISHAESDIVQCYNLHANAYITKPFEFERFMKIFESLVDFWLNVTTLPPRKEHAK